MSSSSSSSSFDGFVSNYYVYIHHSPQLLFGSYNWNPPSNAKKLCSWDGPKTKNCNFHNTAEGLIHLAHSAGTEVWPSLGGWSLSDPFSELARSADNRKKFADNCGKLVEEYGFDGIDIGKYTIFVQCVHSTISTLLTY